MDREEFIMHITDTRDGYELLVEEYESRGLENLNSEEIESYGAYLGKLDLCHHLLAKYGEK